VGWAVAPTTITNAIRKVHDFLTVGAPAPLQEAGAAALSLPPSYYDELAKRYRNCRDRLIPSLEKAGFRCYRPQGAYYVMTDISAFGFANDVEFAAHLVKEIGIACVPGSSFTSIQKTDPNRYVSPSARSLRHWMRRHGDWKSCGPASCEDEVLPSRWFLRVSVSRW